MGKKILTALLCALLLTVSAFAADYTVPRITTDCTVDKAAVCRITQKIDLSFNSTAAEPQIPIAAGAKKISLTGADYTVREKDGVSYAVLKARNGFSGELHLELSYTVKGTVSQEGEMQLFEATLLDGSWETRIERYAATVTFPGELKTEPIFLSGYLSEDVAQKLTTHTQGSATSTSLRGGLLDRESFAVSLRLPEPIFSGYRGGASAGGWLVPVLILALAAAAAVYWFLSLRSRRLYVHARTYAPEAMTAAEAPFVLCGGNIRFGLLLCQWANLGYLNITAEGGRITLCRMMEMGSERREAERKLFEMLFRNGDTCLIGSAEANRTAELAQRGLKNHWARRIFDRTGGNILLLRAAAALCCGLAIAYSIGNGSAASGFLRGLLLVLSFIAGGFCGWLVTYGYSAIRLRDRKMIAVSAAALLFLYIVGRFSGGTVAMLLAVLLTLFTAYAASFGGKLSAVGGSVVEQLLGYRRHLRNIPASQLEQMLTGDQQNFYETLLYAQALGLSGRMTAQMQQEPLPPCVWLRLGGKEREYSPQQFAALLQRLIRRLEQG